MPTSFPSHIRTITNKKKNKKKHYFNFVYLNDFFLFDCLIWTHRQHTFHIFKQMAQALAIPGDVRHSFEFMVSFEHDFGRITGIAASGRRKKCILLCDYLRKNLVLVDSRGRFMNSLPTESEPYDVAITWSNIGYVTLPNARSVLQIDPELMVVLMKIPCPDCNNSVLCLSRLPHSETIDESAPQVFTCKDDKESCMVTSVSKGSSYALKIGPGQT